MTTPYIVEQNGRVEAKIELWLKVQDA